jgi:hypothetical protein
MQLRGQVRSQVLEERGKSLGFSAIDRMLSFESGQVAEEALNHLGFSIWETWNVETLERAAA